MNQDESTSLHIDARTSIPAAMNLWELYLLDQGRSEHTVKSFLGDLRLLTRFLLPGTEIGRVSTQDLANFISWLENGRGRNIPCSPKSLSRRVTTIKSFFRWLAANGRIPFDPAAEIAQQSVISPLPEVLTSAEIKKALDVAQKWMVGRNPDSRPYVLFKLLMDTGIKKSQCLNIRHSHFNLDESDPYLFVRYPDQKDRNKERKVAVSDKFVQAYAHYLEEYRPTDLVFPWSPRRLEYILEDIGKAANISKHISFSMCRWNAALQDWQNGLDRDLIRQKLGISKIQWREVELKLKQLARNQE